MKPSLVLEMDVWKKIDSYSFAQDKLGDLGKTVAPECFKKFDLIIIIKWSRILKCCQLGI